MFVDSKYRMKVNGYKEGTWEKTGEVEISVGDVARALRDDEKFSEMLADYMNTYCNEYKKGQDIGKLLQYQHRTLQGSVCRLLVGMLVGMADTEYFDARNEKAVELGKKVKEMIESGELNFGYLI